MHLFDPDDSRGKQKIQTMQGGRGSVYFLHAYGQDWVLRHYRRGGLVRKVLFDQYFGLSNEQTRSWREWRLLCQLFKEGFPVPRPVAASACWLFCCYRASLITEKIPDTTTLAQLLTQGKEIEDLWLMIGQCLGRFHSRGVFHADLNAHNILINPRCEIFLIDFDRGQFRPTGPWKKNNLKRLHRSLVKVSQKNSFGVFDKECWSHLLKGYDLAG